jgi:hypothetical protein
MLLIITGALPIGFAITTSSMPGGSPTRSSPKSSGLVTCTVVFAIAQRTSIDGVFAS